MINTIDKTTEEDLLRSIIDGSIEGTFEDDTITELRPYKFYGCKKLEKVNLPNLTRVSNSVGGNNYTFAGCTSLKIAYLPKLTGTYSLISLFNGCTSLELVDLSSLTGSVSNRIGSMFENCSSLKKLKFYVSNTLGGNVSLGARNLEYFILPNLEVQNACLLRGDTNIKVVDFGALTSLYGSASITTSNLFYGDAGNLEAIIIRSSSVPTLTGEFIDRSLSTDSTTKTNSTYKIYVPQSLISEYKSATNWSSYSTFFEPIEGSEYDGYWADGSPLVSYSTFGTIVYYNVGNASDWNSSTKMISSHTENEFDAYNCGTQWAGGTKIENQTVPTEFYDGYAQCGLNINFKSAIKNISDTITLEFVFASSGGLTVGSSNYNSNIDTIFSGFNGNFKKFSLITITISESKASIYINGNLSQTKDISSAILNRTFLRIIDGGYLGHVFVWNKTLTTDEITSHYNYYVENAHVGETAFDNNGNFIAE